MKKYANSYAQEAYDAIVPLLGDIMAQNVLKVQSQRIGKTEDTLTPADMQKLAETIKNGLIIFLGADGAGKVAAQVARIK